MQNTKPVDALEILIKKAQQGDTLAFKGIVTCYQSYAYALAFRFICDEDDAEDIVQESFIRIWEHVRDFDPRTKFTTWMYKIVVNLCLDKIKVNKRRMNVFTRSYSTSLLESSVDTFDLEHEYSNKEMAALIKSLANGLSNKQRMIFLLRDFQDLSIEEVTDITGMSESSIKTNLFYARQNIRRKLVLYEASK
jgi:RNA polymerase sigma-70 factor, ECF subfamily